MDDEMYREKASAVVVNDDGEFLLVQLKNYGEGQWNVPGGGIEDGESPENAILRELGEELGTGKFEIVERSDILNKYEFPQHVIDRYLKEKKLKYLGQEQVQFIVKFVGDKSDIAPDPGEIKQFKWVKYEELKDHLVFPGQWENVEAVVKASNIDVSN